ncbi:hypothetical protein PLESTB_001451400 [Pleodorina starrii]|uniref:Uncharacterized protein n=1 Tax=Pleodorina starrii TaxID=330485 RepID=A0A9W6F7G3_9CHLO|nr:hypothetical protein PLESTM_000774000 [Pleodorina starrii]GLC59129.1 hypothetical protein PLESTB_001451400 [Pleodorina starrii]GLC64980.1 hypothetical protein PLESTF_000232400 [Pleodorina starrii]
MAVPGKKQTCYICSDEVTDAEYRRELTCSYGACPGSEHAYHEDCINKYLRKLKLPTDQLIGYQCPVTLDNGKPCSGRITGTHHRMPLNQKKKQKRVEAAAAAAALPKLKLSAPKAKESKPGVAAATAAMRPAGEGALRQVGLTVSNVRPVASTLANVTTAVKFVAPGSGPAARLNGTALAVSNNSSMIPERVVRQRVIPGWSALENVRKASAMPQVDRAKLAALKAEAKAGAGRSSKAQVANTAAGPAGAAPQGNREAGGTRVRQPSSPQHDDGEEASEDVDEGDTHASLRYAREAGVIYPDAGDGDSTRSEKPQDFNLTQEDFPAFPFSTPSSTKMAITADVVAPIGTPKLETVSSSGSSIGGFPVSPMTVGEPSASLDATAPVSPAALDDEEDPIVGYDQLYETEEGLLVVQDVHGNCYEYEAVYGASAVVCEFQDASGFLTYYVIVRKSTMKKAQQEAEAVVLGDNGAVVTTTGVIPEPTAAPPDPQAPVPNAQLALQYSMPDAVDVVTAGPGGGQAVQQAAFVQAEPVGGVDEQEADLDDLLALCMVSAPVLGPKPSLPESQPTAPYAAVSQSPMSQGASVGKLGLQAAHSAGYIAEAPASVDEIPAEDVDDLMALLRV